MQLSHYFYQIVRTLEPFCNTNSPLVLDIGAGYGGVMAKMKKAFSPVAKLSGGCHNEGRNGTREDPGLGLGVG